MLSRSGAPKIMDFGIARIDTSELTSPGEIFGTPLYMAPEQALGQTVDARSDIFSLGSVTYAMLTGRSPFLAATVPAILAQVAHKDPSPPSELVPGLPESPRLRRRPRPRQGPDARYPRARALAEDLDDVRSGRPPRHRAGYVVPARGERTLVALRSTAEPHLETLDRGEIGAGEPPATKNNDARRVGAHPSDFSRLWAPSRSSMPSCTPTWSTSGRCTRRAARASGPSSTPPTCSSAGGCPYRRECGARSGILHGRDRFLRRETPSMARARCRAGRARSVAEARPEPGEPPLAVSPSLRRARPAEIQVPRESLAPSPRARQLAKASSPTPTAAGARSRR